MKRKLWLLLIPAIFVAIPVARLVFAGEEEVQVSSGIPVLVSTPERRDLEESLDYPGTLRAENTTVVVPRIAGRVDRILVEANERVAAGDLIAELESEMVRIQMEQARAGWQAAEAQLRRAQRGAPEQEIENARATIDQSQEELDNAQSNLDRTKRLYDAGTVSRADFERAENQFQAAETQLENARRSLGLMEDGASEEELAAVSAQAEGARKQYELAQLQFQYAKVLAPVAGIVSDVLVEPGNTINVGQPIVSIINTSLIYVIVQVPERHYGAIFDSYAAGALYARVSPVAYEDAPPFDARVSSVANTIDPRSRTFEVEIATENIGGRLRPGMYVGVELILDVRANALSVPASAIVLRDQSEVVFVVSDGGEGVEARVTQVPVSKGLEAEGWVQVESGLEDGTRIVIEGNSFLEDGQAVRIVEAQ